MSPPLTMAEKVMARTAGLQAVDAGAFVTARPDLLMCHEAFGLCLARMRQAGVTRLADPERVVVILDHYFPAPTVRTADAHARIRAAAKSLGIEHFLGHAGICHQVLAERGFVRPGALILGTDSHSSTYGGLGAAGAGVGVTEMTYLLATGEIWMQVPQTIRVWLEGALGAGVMSKDVALVLAGQHGADMAQYMALEFAGPGAAKLSASSRLTVANMGVELGAKFAFFEADDVALDYLRERSPNPVEPFGPDAGARYVRELTVDLGRLEPQVACPHSPANVQPVTAVAGQRLDQLYLGSCANGRFEDLEIAARLLKGRRVDPSVRLIVTPASHEIAAQAARSGVLADLMDAGAHVTASGCGACPGGHGGVVGKGEVCLSSTNRNFRGRMGSPEADVFLASPATVAASAIKGRLADPREFL